MGAPIATVFPSSLIATDHPVACLSVYQAYVVFSALVDRSGREPPVPDGANFTC